MDNVYTNGGSLTVSLVRTDSDLYEIANSPLDSATVKIIDIDPDPSLDEDPTISISSNISSAIIEGDTVTMTLTSTQVAPENGLVINLCKESDR